MNEPITLIEKVVILFLMNSLNTENVYAERPVELPEEYYIVERTGKSEENQIQSATVVVQSISSVSLLRAAEMDHVMEGAMKYLITVPNVSRCKLNTSYNFTDEESKQYRYQAVFDITYMEGA